MALDIGARLAIVVLLLILLCLVTALELCYLGDKPSTSSSGSSANVSSGWQSPKDDDTSTEQKETFWRAIWQPRFRNTTRQLIVPTFVASLAIVLKSIVFANQGRVS
ncbi:hypothetical protein CC86DRAFT_381722 [Ophiobolus disseminans]|uniref:Uncharacterized protein n=1 Tax=Ophiobolus disseminans TaxID=1469910 RepID=A0A6A7A0H7_9PLEO|nr:hypothetical protein CC86DRAFT_381722 [Ophiobolus disseminans]